MGSYVSDCEPTQTQTHWHSIAKLHTVHGEPTLLHSLIDRQLQAEEYRLIIPIQSVEQQIKNYRNRLQKWSNLINIFHISSEQTSLNCMKRIELSVITERVHYRLKDLSKEILTDQQGWYLLHEALNGLLQYYRIFRSFIYLNSRMMGIKSNGEVRIWVNQNWALNQTTKKAQSQNFMVDELIEQIKEYLPTNNKITKFHLQRFNRGFKIGDVLRQCERNIKQIQIESIRKKIANRLRNNIQNYYLDHKRKQTLNHYKQALIIQKLEFCTEQTRKYSNTDRTMHSSTHSSKISQTIRSPCQNQNYLINSNTTKNNSVPTCVSPTYVFSPVLYHRPQTRVKTHYTDRSFTLQSPTPVSVSFKKHYQPEVSKIQSHYCQDNQDSFLKSRNGLLSTTFRDNKSKVSYFQSQKNYSITSPISINSKVIFNYTSSLEDKSMQYQQMPSYQQIIPYQQSPVKSYLIEEKSLNNRLSPIITWMQSDHKIQIKKQIRPKTESTPKNYSIEDQSIIHQAQFYEEQTQRMDSSSNILQRKTIFVVQNHQWKTCSADISNNVKKKEKVAEQEQTIGQNSRGLSQPPNLDNCSDQFDDLSPKLPNQIAFSQDLSQDPYFQEISEKKQEQEQLPTYQEVQKKNISDTYQGKNVIQIFKFYLDSYNNLQKPDSFFLHQQTQNPISAEYQVKPNQELQQNDQDQCQDSYEKQSYEDYNSYLDTIQQASQGEQSATTGFASRKSYQQ